MDVGGVDYPLHFAVVHQVQEVGAAPGDAEHGPSLDADLVEHGGGAAGDVQAVAQVHQLADEGHGPLLVFVAEGHKDASLCGDLVARCQLGFQIS